MDFGRQLDKINTPIYICENDWRIVYRNKACKKYTSAPRVNSSFDRCFLDKKSVVYPEKQGGFNLLYCKVNESFKTAISFEYSGYAVVMFPLMLEYEFLFGDDFKFLNKDAADCVRNLFDVIIEGDHRVRDKYGMVEKLRKYIFSSVENYVTLSLFENHGRNNCSLSDLYKFMYKRVINITHRAGYKIQMDISNTHSFGDGVFVDTAYFTTVMSSLLLFCLSVSKNGKCIVSAENMGLKVRNKIEFAYDELDSIELYGQSLESFIESNPIDYFNVLPYEELCRSLRWEIGYLVNHEKELNTTVYFDVNIDTATIFNSPGVSKIADAESTVDNIITHLFSPLL